MATLIAPPTTDAVAVPPPLPESMLLYVPLKSLLARSIVAFVSSDESDIILYFLA